MTVDSPMTVVVWAAGLFTVAGIGFAKLAEDFTGDGRAPYALVIVGAALALPALVAAAAPSGVALVRGRDAGAGKYLAVPIATVAAVLSGLQVHAADPAGFRGDRGILATPFVSSWIPIVVALAVATALAAWAGRRDLTAVH